jgi:hypothetical protein
MSWLREVFRDFFSINVFSSNQMDGILEVGRDLLSLYRCQNEQGTSRGAAAESTPEPALPVGAIESFLSSSSSLKRLVAMANQGHSLFHQEAEEDGHGESKSEPFLTFLSAPFVGAAFAFDMRSVLTKARCAAVEGAAVSNGGGMQKFLGIISWSTTEVCRSISFFSIFVFIVSIQNMFEFNKWQKYCSEHWASFLPASVVVCSHRRGSEH